MPFQDILQRLKVCYSMLLYHPRFGQSGKYSNSTRTQGCFSWEVWQVIMWLPALIIMPNTFDIVGFGFNLFSRHSSGAIILGPISWIYPCEQVLQGIFAVTFLVRMGVCNNYRKNISAKWRTVTGNLIFLT